MWDRVCVRLVGWLLCVGAGVSEVDWKLDGGGERDRLGGDEIGRKSSGPL